MRDDMKFYTVFLYFILIAGIPFSSMAADLIPLPPSILGVTSGGLLTGMTPGNYKIPSGWSLVRAQDFEGSIPSPEEVWGSSVISTDKPHTGSKSVKGVYDKDQRSVAWNLNLGVTGTFSEMYVSYFEWIDSAALFNDEFWLAKFHVDNPVYQEIILAWMWGKDANNISKFNGAMATLYAVSQGPRDHRHFNSLKGSVAHDSGVTATVPKGAWVQWEIHYRQNTPTAPTEPVSDGFMRVYKDGNLFAYAEKANLNGLVSMNNLAIMVGGIYTKLVWMTDSPTCTACSSRPGQGTDYCTGSKGWFGQSFSNPICAPIDPSLPSFNRFIDDIILMKR